ncbi:pseudouridine synthase [Hymenopellis radicata]|nr:pseudouridine synthase [Hymenopellis radicata]
MSYGTSFRYAVRRISTSVTPTPVIYADRGVVVLNKPSGLVSQGSLKEDDALHRVLSDIKRAYNYARVPMPVHRLDKTTTGCLLLAATANMSRELSRQFQQGLIKKTYLAVVHGVPTLTLRNGRVSTTNEKGKECITSWELLGHRFRTDGPHKRFQLGIRAPPPTEFLDACSSLAIQVPEQDARGCVTINGVEMGHGDVLPLDGRWVGP